MHSKEKNPEINLWQNMRHTARWPLNLFGENFFFCTISVPPVNFFFPPFAGLPFLQYQEILLPIPARERITKFLRVSDQHACSVGFLGVIHDIFINDVVRIALSSCPATLKGYSKYSSCVQNLKRFTREVPQMKWGWFESRYILQIHIQKHIIM